MRSLAITGMIVAALLFAGAASAFQKSSLPPMPYKTVDDPKFISASDASFLADPDRLIGLAKGNAVKAYPAAILAQHGVVLDESPDGPIAVTW
jgi:hypothetical protein